MTEAERLKEYLGREVVIDTDTPLLYVGTLASANGPTSRMRGTSSPAWRKWSAWKGRPAQSGQRSPNSRP